MPSSQKPGSEPLELWGGVECTVNRVGDRYFDQLERSGHAERHGDIGRLGTLGIQARVRLVGRRQGLRHRLGSRRGGEKRRTYAQRN